MWDNYTYFLKAVMPIAEQLGSRCASPRTTLPSLHSGGGQNLPQPRVVEASDEIVPSDYNGLEFCQGTVSEMPEDVLDAIRYFGSRDKIFYVHFRNVSGPVPTFDETFIDEGHVDMLEAMKLYKEIGFDGPMIDDHSPMVIQDPGYGYRSRAYSLGYIGPSWTPSMLWVRREIRSQR